jgi:alanine-glyoxylate transaminase/serine-glyoxylate transaminase/serine-pyruvate transaminase
MEEMMTDPAKTATAEAHRDTTTNSWPLQPRGRLLLGPGPSNLHPRVQEALSKPLVGHLDPQFLGVMDEMQEMLRRTFLTANELTLAVSGTGSAGMEAILTNLVEPGDQVLVCVNGLFGGRMSDIVERIGGVLHRIDRSWGEVFEPAEVLDALERHPEVRLVAIVHAETSTGAHQPLVEIGRICRERGVLFVVDAVTSLGGAELRVDDWHIDACYSGSQKCLSCPPGLAPVTLGPRAVDKLQQRSSKIVSWYFDFTLIQSYWSGSRRSYHHTAPIAMNYALHQALALVLEEGLERRWQRHLRHSHALMSGLGALGLSPFAQKGHRLPMLNAVRVPPEWDEGAIRNELLRNHDIEIGGGLGSVAGSIWRIGLMGESARRENVMRVLSTLEEVLFRRRYRSAIGAGLEAAATSYDRAS